MTALEKDRFRTYALSYRPFRSSATNRIFEPRVRCRPPLSACIVGGSYTMRSSTYGIPRSTSEE